MRRIIAAMLLIAILPVSAVLAQGEDTRALTWPELGFSLRLPADWEDVTLSPEAASNGVFYAAQAPDGLTAMVARSRLVARGDARTPEAYAALYDAQDEVTVHDPIEADGHVFYWAEERFSDEVESVLYQVATTTLNGKRIQLIFIDRTGEKSAAPLAIVSSYTRLDGAETTTSIPLLP